MLLLVLENLDFDDVFNLRQTCKYFRLFIAKERISKAIIQVSRSDLFSHACHGILWPLLTVLQAEIPYTNEAREAAKEGHGNARALHRVTKRPIALSTASLFVVATITFCDAYLYCSSFLCYTINDKLRLLNLHYSSRNELVISIPKLLLKALSGISDNWKGLFQILYYSDYICRVFTNLPIPIQQHGLSRSISK